jgi:hypothetical protein
MNMSISCAHEHSLLAAVVLSLAAVTGCLTALQDPSGGIVVNTVSFEDTPLSNVVERLNQQIRAQAHRAEGPAITYDPSPPVIEWVGVNDDHVAVARGLVRAYRGEMAQKQPAPVTLSATQIPLEELLSIISGITGTLVYPTRTNTTLRLWPPRLIVSEYKLGAGLRRIAEEEARHGGLQNMESDIRRDLGWRVREDIEVKIDLASGSVFVLADAVAQSKCPKVLEDLTKHHGYGSWDVQEMLPTR